MRIFNGASLEGLFCNGLKPFGDWWALKIGGVVVMKRGRVKWFNESKGYGFIAQDDGPDVFVHYTAIEGEGFRTLSEGEEVEFEAIQGEKGLQATRVVKL